VPVRDNLFAIRMPGTLTWTPVTFYQLADGAPLCAQVLEPPRKVGS
jgi:hypothetical protein